MLDGKAVDGHCRETVHLNQADRDRNRISLRSCGRHAVINPRKMIIISDIERLVQRFVSGADTSIEAANEIEVALDDSFPDSDYVQQTVEMLAMYRPGGGELLFDTAAIRQRLIETMKQLQGP
jgi:hypothetical protein